MVLSYLILAHLLGDFVFQPTKLVLWKWESKNGVFVHVLIHFLISTIVLMPFLINGHLWLLGMVFLISLVHFLIDQSKINYDIKHDKKVMPFVVDQLLHFVTILAAYYFIKDFLKETAIISGESVFYSLYSNMKIVIFVVVIILCGKVVEIFHFERRREKNKNAKFKLNSDKMLTRIIVITLFYGLFILLSFYEQSGPLL